MKTFAAYDQNGKIKKVFATTKGKEFVEKNMPKGFDYVEVSHGVTTSSHQIIDGKAEKDPSFIPRPLIGEPPMSQITRSFGITEQEIDKVKDIDELKELLKKMISKSLQGEMVSDDIEKEKWQNGTSIYL